MLDAEECSTHYLCPDYEPDGWGGEPPVGREDKPWCPWAVRPGKCQPEVATMLLRQALEDYDRVTLQENTHPTHQETRSSTELHTHARG